MKIVLGNTPFSRGQITDIENTGIFMVKPNFIVSKDGHVQQMSDRSPYFKFIEEISDEESITIGLENKGFFTQSEDSYKSALNLRSLGDIYTKAWRNKSYWDIYTEMQFDSTVDLVKSLLGNLEEEPNVAPNNIILDNLYEYNIVYRSNISKSYLDLNPSWNFKKFKKIIDER